ncbi:Mthfs 5-formyltetrahydrofolate cyclo-ligase [Candida maltosa Xu316]|uniref:5-formyltetrahydrofolate cyclo-ligase n=1 Tax=Candida maltosa (strain Xu316) TaxID=1245528 RepID=M3J4B8_CANMX|nr:hypothetical protein G210_2888 [Candida maltosa Xu316]
MSALKEAKKQLRKQIKAQLKTISQESLITQSSEIHQNLQTHEYFQNANHIAVFMNMPDSEVKTREIIKSCFELGKNVYLPRCNYTPIPGRKKNYMSMIKMPSWESVLELKPQGKYQLLEPLSGEDAMDTGNLELIIVPGVAFDKNKHRMGHGAGFYDEFITTFTKNHNTRPRLLGVSLEEQMLDNVPTEDHDWKLDSIITPSSIIY